MGQARGGAGLQAYVVGGAVRDHLLGRPVQDYDMATDAQPEEVLRLFRRVIPTGIAHGTVTVRVRDGNVDHGIEVTTFRIDGTYRDARRPESVTFASSSEQDLARRDFTINAMALDPRSDTIVDPYNGRADLPKRIIRTVGEARERFGEDALRVIRAARFAAQLQFAVDDSTRAAMKTHAHTVNRIAIERVTAEFDKMMKAERPSVGWRLLAETGVLAVVLPELLEDRAPEYTAHTDAPPVFEHLLTTCDCAPLGALNLRYAALLHDIGKPRCFHPDQRGVSFVGHDEESARMAEAILTRLRASNERVAAVVHLVRHHMFGYTSDWSDAAVRRFLHRVGLPEARDLIRLRRADACGKVGRPIPNADLDELEERIAAIESKRNALQRGDLAVNGKSVMQATDLPAGPLVGVVLEELLQAVLEDPTLNQTERLLEMARRIVEQRHLKA